MINEVAVDLNLLMRWISRDYLWYLQIVLVAINIPVHMNSSKFHRLIRFNSVAALLHITRFYLNPLSAIKYLNWNKQFRL
jgi:hypothetical protein